MSLVGGTHSAALIAIILLNMLMISRGFSRGILAHRRVIHRSMINQPLLGVSDTLAKSLSSIGIDQLTEVQQLSYPVVKGGSDVIIGAETGSGKTLAYMLPLVDALLANPVRETTHPRAIVLAPTKELCQQICNMCSGLAADLKKKGHSVRIEPVSEAGGHYSLGDEADAPAIVVCTPRHLAALVRGPVILHEGLFESVRHVVLDEADMLLQGSYLRDVEKVLDAFKVVRRGAIRRGEIQVHEKGVQYVLVAATLPSSGTRSVLSYTKKRFPSAELVQTQALHAHHPSIQQEFLSLDIFDKHNSDHEMVNSANAVEVGSMLHTRFVVAAILRKYGQPLQEVADMAAAAEQINSLDHQVMVFLNTAEAAQCLACSLADLGVRCGQFHKLAGADVRKRDLQAFREGAERILVCTDSAGRGLDLPNVRHVVQAEFALNVVQHQHRVGRASRAGKAGRATSFFGPAAEALVQSIRGAAVRQAIDMALEEGLDNPQDSALSTTTICGSFSRRRGFRKSIKRALQNALTDDQ